MTVHISQPSSETAADQPRGVESSAEPSRSRQILLRSLPWVIAALAAVAVLHWTGTPDRQIAVYGVYLVLAVVLPGTLVWRGLFGSRGNWPEDLGLGAAAGLIVQLVGWALAAATGVELLLPIWLGLVVLVFLAVPGLRRHWRTENQEPLPILWSWGMAGVFVLLALWAASNFRGTPLPPTTFGYYQDIYYHLALVHEMTRSMPFQVPQVAGQELRYHYLSDADMASASMLTGIDPATVYLRLWLLPVAAVAAMVFAVLARTVSGRWWTGPVAAALGLIGVGLSPSAPILSGGPLSLLSPSQVYALPLVGLFLLIAVEALRGRPLRWAWAAVPLLAVVCAGSKSSVLPPLFAGVGLVALVLLLQQRRIPWVAVGLLGTIAFGMVVGLRLFAGGGAGTLKLQPLALLRWMNPYTKTIGGEDGMTQGGFLPPGVEHAGTAGIVFVAALVLWWIVAQVPRLVGLVSAPRDMTYWLLGGTVFGGTAAAWLFWHPAASQGYFFTGVIPVGAVLTTAALAHYARRWWPAVAAAVVASICLLVLPQPASPSARAGKAEWVWFLFAPTLWALAIAAVLIAVAVVIWKKRAVRSLPAVLLAAIVGASIFNGVYQPADSLDSPLPKVNKHTAVTAAEMRAAFWLDKNAGEDDLVATNVHCVPMDAKKVCNARAFWVAGLGGRRTLVESWGYTDVAVASHGVNGLRYSDQPFEDQALFAFNQRVFTEAKPQDVQRMRDEYGVRWLFADSRVGKLAPSLAQVATLRYTSGTAQIYELR